MKALLDLHSVGIAPRAYQNVIFEEFSHGVGGAFWPAADRRVVEITQIRRLRELFLKRRHGRMIRAISRKLGIMCGFDFDFTASSYAERTS